MRKLTDIPPASLECVEFPEDESSRKLQLARQLEASGHQVIAVGRALVTIERCDPDDQFPAGNSTDPLRLAIYHDPDVFGGEDPVYVYIHGGRSGLGEIFLQVLNAQGRERLWKFESQPVRSEW